MSPILKDGGGGRGRRTTTTGVAATAAAVGLEPPPDHAQPPPPDRMMEENEDNEEEVMEPARPLPPVAVAEPSPGELEKDRSVVVSDYDDDEEEEEEAEGLAGKEEEEDEESNDDGKEGAVTEPAERYSNDDTTNHGTDDSVDELTQAVEQIRIEPVQQTSLLPSSSAEVSIPSSPTAVLIPEALQTVADWIRTSTKILVVSGAGVSVAAGIPDFRSPGTGLYDNLQKYNLPYPEAVFELKFYQRNPHPFLNLAKELWPSGRKYAPTLTHSFLALLADKRRLLRIYTQNIDGLEFVARIPEPLLVECHGHFRTASCLKCKTPADPTQVERTILHGNGQIPTCAIPKCAGYVKPDIVFFGENLPDRFHSLWKHDTGAADLCLVLGTSLQVAPVSQLPDLVDCPRVLLNREPAGTIGKRNRRPGGPANRRHPPDLFHPGDCDDSVRSIATALGWESELLQWHAEAQTAAAAAPL